MRSNLGLGSTFTLSFEIDDESPLNLEAEPSVVESVLLPSASMSQPEKNNLVIIQPKKTYLNTLPIEDDRQNISPLDNVILIIEDDEAFVNILISSAHKKGFKCVISNFGEDALSLVKRFNPIALLLDIGLKKMSGKEVIATLRGDEMGHYLPFFVISSHSEMTFLPNETPIGLLEKPIDFNDIDKIISNISSLDTKKPGVKVLHVNSNNSLTLKLKEPVKLDHVSNLSSAINALNENFYDCLILDCREESNKIFSYLSKIHAKGLNPIPMIVIQESALNSENKDEISKHNYRMPLAMLQKKDHLEKKIECFLNTIINIKTTAAGSKEVYEKLFGKRVLVVDDDPNNCYVMKEFLLRLSMVPIIVNSAKEAYKALESDPEIALVLMDIMMPEINGYEAIQTIRETINYLYLPIIAVTAKALPKDRIDCLSSGANDYIMKPIDDEKLKLAIIRHIIRMV